MTLGERIALARKKAGLSQEQLGDQLGVSRQAVSKWESGAAVPDTGSGKQRPKHLIRTFIQQ